MDSIPVWGIKINPLRKADIVSLIDDHLTNKDGVMHLTGVNPETISQAQTNTELLKAINSSDLVNIDNMLVTTCLRLLGYKIPERAACPDIFELLLELSNRKGYTVYFLGAREEILVTMIEKISHKYPTIKIAGSRNGYFKTEDEARIVEVIRSAGPDMLFIALPTPQKELFINRNKDRLGTRFAFGVGGAFDVQAEKVVRAPEWMRSIGLEGIHRALQNPSDYGKRYLKYYLPFLKLFFKELVKPKQINKKEKT
jgi:N-acetylglucosaminyldiphosphoundecaprenol N-acetyl-beta-D-mannosaminyltransferase